MWLVLQILTGLILSCAGADRPRVKTSIGGLEGVWQTSAKGLQYAAFMGIPYAQPPVGDLRFEVTQDNINNITNFFLNCHHWLSKNNNNFLFNKKHNFS